MDSKAFKKLCEAIGGLTGPQMKQLRAVLRSLDSRMQVWRDNLGDVGATIRMRVEVPRR